MASETIPGEPEHFKQLNSISNDLENYVKNYHPEFIRRSDYFLGLGSEEGAEQYFRCRDLLERKGGKEELRGKALPSIEQKLFGNKKSGPGLNQFYKAKGEVGYDAEFNKLYDKVREDFRELNEAAHLGYNPILRMGRYTGKKVADGFGPGYIWMRERPVHATATLAAVLLAGTIAGELYHNNKLQKWGIDRHHNHEYVAATPAPTVKPADTPVPHSEPTPIATKAVAKATKEVSKPTPKPTKVSAKPTPKAKQTPVEEEEEPGKPKSAPPPKIDG